ncbi:MAG: KEOPS complex N(6)-L-threonylcarbamoyladenine synthase Kae1 [Nitrososphaeria archaeon]
MKENRLLCLGVESTAHTFSVSVLDDSKILSNEKEVYVPPPGEGIHPYEAAQHHLKKAKKVLQNALIKSGVSIKDIDVIAYSAGPGLGPCLRVGAVVARTLANYYNKPLTAVNHAIGHIELANFFAKAIDPVVVLVSGGHTLVSTYLLKKWRIFGETLDITLGQLFDQLGRELGFNSPAGKYIEELAGKGKKYLEMPYSVKGNNVSFSGLLTYAKNLIKKGYNKEDVCYSVQETAFAMLTEVTERLLAFSEKKEIILTGGVAANLRLQEMIRSLCEVHDAKFYVIPKEFSGDCGAQIALVGLLQYKTNNLVDIKDSVVRQSWRIDEVEVTWRD